jgi:hypothetical protein
MEQENSVSQRHIMTKKSGRTRKREKNLQRDAADACCCCCAT